MKPVHCVVSPCQSGLTKELLTPACDYEVQGSTQIVVVCSLDQRYVERSKCAQANIHSDLEVYPFMEAL